MNHVPDAALAELDAFGEGWLHGDPLRVRATLREDLRVEVWAADGTIHVRFETEHTQAPATLRDRGSYMTTVVDGIDRRLREWGFEPPGTYVYVDTVGTTHQYEGTITPP